MLKAVTKPWSTLSYLEQQKYKEYTSQNTQYNSPFYQYAFVDSVDKSLNSPVQVLIINIYDVPIAFLPYHYKTLIDELVGLAEKLGGNMSDYFGPVIAPNYSLDAIELVRLAEFNRLPYDHLPYFDFQLHMSSADMVRNATKIVVNEGAEKYFDWLMNYNKKFYNDTLRRKRKALIELGEMSFRFDNQNQFELENLIRMKQAQYNRTSVGNALAEHWKKTLLLNLFNIGNDSTLKPILSTLYFGDKWMATHFGLAANGILQYWFPVYNPEYNKYAPGRLLLFSIIEQLNSHNISIIDRGEGVSDAKLDMANFFYRMSKGEFNKQSLCSLFSCILLKLRWRFSL